MATIQQLYSILEQYVDIHAIWHVMNRTDSIWKRQPTRHIARHHKNLSLNRVTSGHDFGINQQNYLCGLTGMAFFLYFLDRNSLFIYLRLRNLWCIQQKLYFGPYSPIIAIGEYRWIEYHQRHKEKNLYLLKFKNRMLHYFELEIVFNRPDENRMSILKSNVRIK